MEEKDSTVCKICLLEASKYTCPRCNLRYCSSTCYKAEGHVQCSELFYKGCCMDAMKHLESSAKDRNKVLEMLNRLEETHPYRDSDDDSDTDNDGDNENNDNDLAERIAGLDLDKDTDAIWEKLTLKEKEQFEAMLSDGRLGNLLESWEPWWTLKDSGLVEDISGDSRSKVPSILQKVVRFDKLLKGSPSPLIPYAIVNILYGYAYVTKIHNGDYLNSVQTICQSMFTVCGGLTNVNFNSAVDAVHQCIQKIDQEESLKVSREFSTSVIRDVICLIEMVATAPPYRYVLAALSELHLMFTNARKRCKQDLSKIDKSHKSFNYLESQKKQWFGVSKKIEFCLSWTNAHGSQLSEVLPILEMEFCSISTDLSKHAEDSANIKKSWGDKNVPPSKQQPLITEITQTSTV